jgi:4-hydroxybutyrate dehydrogenase
MSQFIYLNQVIIEFGALKQLSSVCEQHGIKKPLLVTDQGIRSAGLVDKILNELNANQHHPVVFDRTPSNPTEAAVRAARQLYVSNSCDGLIGLGGGSAIDCAKGVAMVIHHPGPLTTYATIEAGSARITADVPPLIAIPTTAGTGSEVARGAVIIVDDGRKLGFHSWHLVPKVALLDPDLTLGLPPLLTAATGMDAITHCMETFIGAAFNPPADGIALDGLQRGWRFIERATRNGDDREARLNMMSSSMQGAMAFQKGLGCVHSLSHSLGGVNPRLHHGTLNAVFLPAVMRFNSEAESVVRDDRMQRVANAIGLKSGGDVPLAVRDLNARLGLPQGLSELGVQQSQFQQIIKGALVDHCHQTNPRVASVDDYWTMLAESMRP